LHRIALRARFALQSALAPHRAVDEAARLFATPPRHGHTPRELELLSIGTRFPVASGDGELAAWRFGHEARPAVVLVHGWGGRGAQLRAFVPALLERGYQVVLFDHVAHGHSPGREATLVHFARGLDAVVAHLEARAVRIEGIVAHSLGAAAAGLWLKESGRALRAVLVAPPTSVERYSGYFARALGIPERVRRAMQERFERMLGRRWSEFELPEAIEGMRAKALVIHDAGDREVAYASGLALARAWPDARLVRTEGLGHRLVLRDPGVVRDAVDFIADRVVFLPPPARGESRPFGAPAPIA
jgi:pimeloyl-ACP methyl ester carboxylesterase